MDQMLPSPSFSNIDIGTPHHPMEDEQMIAPSAQEAQQGRPGGGNPLYSFGGFTPSAGAATPGGLLSSGQTPHNMLGSLQGTPQNLLGSAGGPSMSSMRQPETPLGDSKAPLYGPVPSPAPVSPAVHQPTENNIIPQLQNIVSTVNMGVKLDLKKIALHARNAEFNPKRFAAVIMRIREPRTTALIFSSGKMVCTGAKSEEDSRLAARKYARIVQKLGFPTKFKDFKIQNMVGSCDVKFPIRLEGLVLTHSQFSSYEPELFPGLIYRMVKPRIVLLIFVSGKVVLTGAKVRQEIYEAFDNIYPILKNFKKQ